MKQCSKCKEWKDRETGFHKDKGKKDGLSSSCKQCVIEHVRRYRQTPRGQEVTKVYNRSGQRKTVSFKYSQTEKAKRVSRKYYLSEKSKRRVIDFREQHPEMQKAGNKVINEVRRGRIPKARDLKCSNCGRQAVHYHHHKGYEKEHWLDVIPLCGRCHYLANHSTKKSLNASAT